VEEAVRDGSETVGLGHAFGRGIKDRRKRLKGAPIKLSKVFGEGTRKKTNEPEEKSEPKKNTVLRGRGRGGGEAK